jgi:hypothetical protein
VTMSAAALDLFGPGVRQAVSGSAVITVAAVVTAVATAHLRWKGLA